MNNLSLFKNEKLTTCQQGYICCLFNIQFSHIIQGWISSSAGKCMQSYTPIEIAFSTISAMIAENWCVVPWAPVKPLQFIAHILLGRIASGFQKLTGN